MKKIEHEFIDGIELKRCSSCKEWLNLKSFCKNRSCWDGLGYQCKSCHGESCRKYCLVNSDKRKESCRKYYFNNINKARNANKKWVEKNPQKAREINKKSVAKCLATPVGRLNNNVKIAVYQSLKNGKDGKSTFDFLGYSVEQLREHLETTIPEGYTWDDYMSGKLHLDHIVPISKHNFEKVEDIDFERCWALTNLQLLSASDNLSKGNKLREPFQPSFIFG